jgi:CMP-N-acetylneuraminic acid synthetase
VNTKLIAMIPARMGSKRVQKKNLRLMCGKPLVQYAIDIAKQSDCFDEIWVNTESEMIGNLAGLCGAGFHRRPDDLATDTATNQDFTTEFLRNHECDYVVMVNPTSPLLKPETVVRFCERVRMGDCDTVLSVLNERTECFYNDQPINFSLTSKINSQEIEPVKKVVWALTAWRKNHFLSAVGKGECGVFSGHVDLFSIPLDESCDIDTQEQWDLAEKMLLSRQLNDNNPETVSYWHMPFQN